MKVIIENVVEHEPRWKTLLLDFDLWGAIVGRTYHVLYLTLQLNNEERHVAERNGGELRALVRTDRKTVLTTPGMLRGKRTWITRNRQRQYVNEIEMLLRKGLKQWKDEMEGVSGHFEDKTGRREYEL